MRYGRHYEPGTRSVDEMVERSLRPTVPAPRMTMREQVDWDRRERIAREAAERRGPS